MVESAQRALIYNKLGELNRISLREAFDAFCNAYAIELADLWPVFTEDKGAGLSDIRNKLIHGDPFPHDLIAPLSIACEHMEYVLQRMIVGVLGWDVKKTKIDRTYLRANLFAIKELHKAKAWVSEYINSQESFKTTDHGEPGGATAQKQSLDTTREPNADDS